MATINPHKRKAVDFSEPTVTVIVGTTKKIFTLHPSILVSGSKLFRSALSGNWQESKTNSITLPETLIRTFQSYASYVYTGEIDICAEELDTATDPEATFRFYRLVELYVLADVTLDDMTLRNAVVDAILDIEGRTGFTPNLSDIELAYDNSSGTNALCNLLLDNALAETYPDWLKKVWNLLPGAYVESLVYGWAQAMCDKTLVYQKSAENLRCKYHEHDEETAAGENCGGKVKPAVPKPVGKKKPSRPSRDGAYCP